MPPGACTPLWRKRGPAPWGRTSFTRRSVRSMFPAVQEVNCPEGARETTLGCAAAKNDLASFRRGRRKPGRGPLPGLSPGDEERKSPVNCLLLSGCLRSGSPRSGLAGERAAAAARRKPPVGCLALPVPPAIRLAAERLRRREGRCGGRTGVPGQLPASIEASAIRLAAWRLCQRGLLAP